MIHQYKLGGYNIVPDGRREVHDRYRVDDAQNILPLPCDRRYGTEDMDAIITILQKTMGECKHG